MTEQMAHVPPNTLAVGSAWENLHALTAACMESGRDQITVIDRDGDVSVWGGALEQWWDTKSSPYYGYEPYTILHAGRKVDL